MKMPPPPLKKYDEKKILKNETKKKNKNPKHSEHLDNLIFKERHNRNFL